MGRTVNGKELKDIFSFLAQYQKPDEKLQGKYPYYKIESYYKRLNNVIGIEHYNVEYSERVYSLINSNQELVSVKCRVTLLDDDFQPICFKEGYGGKEIEYGEKSGKQAGFKNLDNNAALNAFKAAWHQFNIFGRATEDSSGTGNSNGSNRSGGNPNSSSGTSSSNTADTDSLVSVCLATQGEIYKKKESQGKAVYKVSAFVIENNTVTQQQVEVVFYHNQYSKNMEMFERYVTSCKERSVKLDIVGSYSDERDGIKQFVFKGWAA